MSIENEIADFLSPYDRQIKVNALLLRDIIISNLPNIKEQIDLPAKMIAYCYGQKYADLICVIIPSKKGLKLGFNRGNELYDPNGLLKGNGKISRYIEIKSEEVLASEGLKQLIADAFRMYNDLRK